MTGRGLAIALLAAALGAGALPAAAQVPPSATEAAAYTGLHAAAWRGDVATIQRLAASKAALEARDAHGRTPLHVATFARQRGAVQALLKAGADSAALESGRYDAVTIAAVADDEETLAVLLAMGASAKLVTSRYDGTALIAAAHLGHAATAARGIRPRCAPCSMRARAPSWRTRPAARRSTSPAHGATRR